MLSLTHLLILVLVLVIFFGPQRLPALFKSIGEGVRQLKKGVNGEGDIDVTHTVKHVEDEKEKERS